MVALSIMGEIDGLTTLAEAKRFMVDCFEAVGTCTSHANIIAENLLESDYRGHYSHGMNRLNFYINDILRKTLDPNAVPRVEKETSATALVNGNNTLGAVVGKYCMDLAIQKAKAVGIGMVTAYKSNHYGIAGIYALQAIKAGCIGLSATNSSPVLVPTRAKQATLGSNPVSFGVPGKEGDSFLLDMATSTVALGKLEVQKRKGEPIPKGWALNEKGEMETDPETAIEASRLLPVGGDELTGGYKGYGLALMIEVLCGILSGASYGPNIPRWNGPEAAVANLGQVFVAINPAVFCPGYENRLTDLMGFIRQMEPRDSEKPVLIPGDPEAVHMRNVDAQGGICYCQDQHDSNRALARELKVEPMKSVQVDVSKNKAFAQNK